MRQPMSVLSVVAVLTLAACGGGGDTEQARDDPGAPRASSTSSAPQTSAPPSAAATPGDPAFCAVAADDSLDTAQPGTQEYADGTAALADAAPPQLRESTEVLRTLGRVQLGLGTDGTPEELQVAMDAQGIQGPALIAAFADVGAYIDTCDL